MSALRGVEPGAENGQTTTEWLMVAGVLMSVVLLLGSLIPKAIRTYVVELMYSMCTIAP